MVVDREERLTRLSKMVTTPSASMVAWSPRSCVTLPTMVTVRPTKLSRKAAVMRGVDICSAMVGDVLEMLCLCLCACRGEGAGVTVL